jgi:hypothetical protein
MNTATSNMVDDYIGGGNTLHDIAHNADYDVGVWDVGHMTKEMFEGKDTRGVGLGGAEDPIAMPFATSDGVFPSVNNVNDQAKSFFPQHRATHEAFARTSASLSATRNDVIFGNLHPMDYDPYPAVGHRHADNPDLDDAGVFDRVVRGAPSEYRKRQLVLPNVSDMDIGYRHTVAYSGRHFQRHRPLLRRTRNSDINEAVYGQETNSSVASEIGRSMPAPRVDTREGMYMKRDIVGFGGVTDGQIYNRESIPTTMGTMGFSHESDAYEIRHAVQVAQVRRDNLLYET